MWYNRFQGFGAPPGRMGMVTKRLLIITIAAFVVHILLWPHSAAGFSPAERVLGLSRSGMASGMPWQIVTYMFLHGGFMHLFGNMLGLYFFGSELEYRLGSRRFLLLYLGTGMLGGLGWLGLSAGSNAICIGASGAVFGVIGTFAALYPHRQITLLVFYVLPVTLTARTLAIIFGAISLLLLRSNAGGIAHAAHLGGGVAGYIYGMRIGGTRYPRPGEFSKMLRQGWAGWRAARRRRQFDVFTRESDAEVTVNWGDVDRILLKVKALGMGSLTREEREVLDHASRHAR